MYVQVHGSEDLKAAYIYKIYTNGVIKIQQRMYILHRLDNETIYLEMNKTLKRNKHIELKSRSISNKQTCKNYFLFISFLIQSLESSKVSELFLTL